MATPSSFNEQDIAQISNYLKSNWSKVIESDPKLIGYFKTKKISPPSFEAWSTENNKRKRQSSVNDDRPVVVEKKRKPDSSDSSDSDEKSGKKHQRQ